MLINDELGDGPRANLGRSRTRQGKPGPAYNRPWIKACAGCRAAHPCLACSPSTAASENGPNAVEVARLPAPSFSSQYPGQTQFFGGVLFQRPHRLRADAHLLGIVENRLVQVVRMPAGLQHQFQVGEVVEEVAIQPGSLPDGQKYPHEQRRRNGWCARREPACNGVREGRRAFGTAPANARDFRSELLPLPPRRDRTKGKSCSLLVRSARLPKVGQFL